MSLTSLDLFAGAGGITEGLRQAGFTCLFANDFDAQAVDTFRLNHPSAEVSAGPIQDLNPARIRKSLQLAKGELDCIAGGSPCQGFSINAPERFLEDPRNSLFREYVRFVEEFQPKTILFENVPGILSLAKGQIFFLILEELRKLGYSVSFRILFAAHYGVPQQRFRMIVLGSRIGEAPSHPLPTHSADGRANFTGGKQLIFRLPDLPFLDLLPVVTVAEAIGDLPALRSGEGAEVQEYPLLNAVSRYASDLRQGSDRIWHHVAPALSPINLERMTHIKPGGSWRDIPYELLPSGMQRARRSDHTKRYGRLRPDGLSGTILTKIDPHWGAVFHYNQDRTLTVREAARIQSFPDRYIFSGSKGDQYRQVGNAVPVLMARAIADVLRQHICGPHSRQSDSLAACL